MRQSQLFTRGKREEAKEEVSENARLLLRAGFIDKLMAGTYSFLPLGLILMRKIERIIRDEMRSLGAQEVQLPALHPKSVWEKTGRWKYEEMFKVTSRAGKDFALGWTHEEIMVYVAQKHIHSYKDLPFAAFQIQTKFRDELRAKSGLLRGVEFQMKDLYSFHVDEQDLEEYFEEVQRAYFRIFERCGIGDRTILTLASGGTFSKYSYEFQAETPAGEDIVYYCPSCRRGVNKEIIEEEGEACPGCKREDLEEKKCIEVGNIFKQGTRFTEPFGFSVKGEDGKERRVYTAAYGIGISRLMGAIAEIWHDEKGLMWPGEVAPFRAHVLCLSDTKEVRERADSLYENLQGRGIEVLYDDRKGVRGGEKLAEADLLGMPVRLVVSENTVSEGKIEVKRRGEDRSSLETENAVVSLMQHV